MRLGSGISQKTFFTLLLLSSLGCAQMGGLRPAWEDEIAQEPTTGGRYASGGLLDEELEKDRRAVRYQKKDIEDPYQADEPIRSVRSEPKKDRVMEKVRSKRLSRKDFVDDSTSDGSLWDSDGQTNYFLTKNKVRNTGDFVTIVSDAELVRDFAYEIKRMLNEDERDDELAIARTRPKGLGAARDPAEKKDPATGDQAAADGEGANESKAPEGDKNIRWADVDLRDAIEFKAGDPVIAEVVSRSSNGTYRLEGVKRIRYRSSYRTVQLSAIVKQADISETDEVPAQKLFEYRLETLQ